MKINLSIFLVLVFSFSIYNFNLNSAEGADISALFPATVKSVTGRDYLTTPFPQSSTATLIPCPPLKDGYGFYDARAACRDGAGMPLDTALPLFPFSSPITRFVGRYLDGGGVLTNKVEWYGLTGGNPIKIVPGKNKIYMREESTIVSYKLDTFFTKISTEPLKFFYRKMVQGSPNYMEAMIPWDDYFYIGEGKEGKEGDSGWEICHGDTGQILFDFDADDRGYLYLGSVSGWGIIRDDGRMLRPVMEMNSCHDGAPRIKSSSRGSNKILSFGDGMPGRISEVVSFKVGSKYYVALGSVGSQEIYIYDVTDVNNPKFERAEASHGGSLMTMTTVKSGTNDIVAILDNHRDLYAMGSLGLHIYNSADLAAGGTPKTFDAPSGAEGYRGLASDPVTGKIFSMGYGLDASKGAKHMYLSVFTPTSKGPASSYKETKYDLGRESSEFTTANLSYNSGNLVAWGYGSKGNDVKIWTIGTGAPVELDVKDYFSKHYSNPPEGYAKASEYSNIINVESYTNQGKSYLFVSTTGQGEVYEINGSTIVGGTNPTDNGCAPGNIYSTTTSHPCACVLGQPFKLGDRGEAVKAFQQILKNESLYTGRVDGIYGPLSSAAAISQCQNKLNPGRVVPTSQVAPVIADIGNKTLSVNTLGEWTVTATDGNKDDLSWSVDWGYGKSTQTCPTRPALGTSKNWSYTFSNSWVTPGTYQVTVYASDCKGHTVHKYFNVTVTGSSGGGSTGGTDVQNRY